jgi:hypothetical protein
MSDLDLRRASFAMWSCGKEATLLRTLERLAFYNDKGIAYARHTPVQVEAERTIGLTRIKELVAEIGVDELPAAFLRAVASGDVARDFTGKYIDLIAAHLDRRDAR